MDQIGEDVGTLADDLVQQPQHGGPLGDGGGIPSREGSGRGMDSGVDLGVTGLGDTSGDCLRSWVLHVPHTGAAGHPGTVDVELVLLDWIGHQAPT